MNQITDLLGVVLCGGESRRMGRDKGLLEKDGKPWVRFMADKLDRWHIPVTFSINHQQQDSYAGILPRGQWVVDALGLAGPLEGLFSVHRQFPHHDLLLLPCDMLDLDQTTIKTLLDAYLGDRANHDFYVFAEEQAGRKYRQPFCGIYTATALHTREDTYLQRQTEDLSLQGLLNSGSVCRLPVGNTEAFRNYNSL